MKNMSARLASLEAKSPSIAQAREQAEQDARTDAFRRRLPREDRRFFSEMARKVKQSGNGLESLTTEELLRLREMHQKHGRMARSGRATKWH